MATTTKKIAKKKRSGSKGTSAPATGKADRRTKAAEAVKGGRHEGGKREKSPPAVDAKEAAKRRLGLRGAAPWAARHAAKHAAEARARAAEPPLPGSARATIRIPVGAEDIKQRIADLHNALTQIKALRKNLAKSFWDIGAILRDIQVRKLYEAKGYGTFDAFLDREIDLGKTTALRLIRVVTTFLKDAAQDHGMEKIFTALNALEVAAEGMIGAPAASRPDISRPKIPPPPISTASLPMKPPGR